MNFSLQSCLTVQRMSDNHTFSTQYASRYSKKRGSVDSDFKTFQRKQKPKQVKQKIAELSIDLNSHKNNKSTSMNKNFTHRPLETKNNNLCDLREQVEQLRMENQSLREEIKSYKNNQSQLKYKIRKLQTELDKQQQLKNNIDKQYENMQDKLKKYSEKIKQLFENLIFEKRKNAGINPTISKIKMALSPSNSSISNSLNLRKFEQQGELDYFNSAKRMEKKQHQDYIKINNYRNYQKNGASIESFENSPSHKTKATRGIIGMPQTFGTRY